MKNIILIVATLFAVVFAQAQDCTLPVCDIPAKVEQLKAGTQNERFVYIKDLRTQYRGETNPINLKNINAFSIEAKQAFLSINEEAWVIREVQGLQNAAVVGLIKYDKVETTYDANGKNNLMRYFDYVTDEGSAFDVLTYWSEKVQKLENIDEVKAIINFAEYAKAWAVSTNQEPYIAREADKIIVVGGKNISRLFPAHEGTYKVKITCVPTPKDCGSLVKTLTYMSIFDSLGERGLVVNIADSVIDAPIYTYTSALLTKAGTHIRGVSSAATPNTRVSELNLDIDFKTGNITGVLQDFGYTGEMHIEATPIRRVTKYYADEGPTRAMTVSETLGRYEGTFSTIQNCTLVVNRYSTGEIIALLQLGDAGTLQFHTGVFNETHGVLSFVGTTPNMGDRKLILAFRKDKKGKEMLTGFMMTTNPRSPEALFYRAN